MTELYVTLTKEESHKKGEIPRKDRGRLSPPQVPVQDDVPKDVIPFQEMPDFKISTSQTFTDFPTMLHL